MSENNGSEEKPGRNAPCPCGSGDKYKVCCGKTEQPEPAPEQRVVEVAVEKKVVWEPKGIEAQSVAQTGGANLGFVVLEGGRPVEHIYVLDEHEKAEVLKQLSSGLVIP